MLQPEQDSGAAGDASTPGLEAQTEEIWRLTQERDEARAELEKARYATLAAKNSIWRRLEVFTEASRKLRRGMASLRRHGIKAVHRDAASEATYQLPRPFRAHEGATKPQRVSHPDVTVVIPVYNSEAWLDDCLSSVLAQSGVSLEVVCINDGSTDGSRSVLQRFADTDSRVSIIDQPNQGQSVGRNAGLDAANGRYLIYLDSDDFWPADTLADLVAQADNQQLDLVMFDCLAFLDGEVAEATWSRYSTYYQRSREYGDVRSGADMIADMRRNRDYRPHVGMYIARTEFVRSSGVRFIPGIIHQDNPYTFGLLLNAARVAHTDADIYARRVRPGSTITTLHDAASVKGYYLSFVSMDRAIHEREYPPAVTEMLCEVIDGVFSGAAKKVASLSTQEFAEIQALDGKLDAQLVIQRLKAIRAR